MFPGVDSPRCAPRQQREDRAGRPDHHRKAKGSSRMEYDKITEPPSSSEASHPAGAGQRMP